MNRLGRALLIAALGCIVIFFGSAVSRLVPALPSAQAFELLQLAASGQADSLPEAVAERTLEANRWYQVAVLPGLAGLLVGLGLGFVLRVRLLDVVLATLVLGALLLALEGAGPFGDPVRWLGLLLFAAATHGGSRFTEDLRATSSAT